RFVRGYAAKVEHEKIRERCMRGKLARVRAGKIHCGGTELYGYVRDKEAGVRHIHEPEAVIVRMVYRWVGEEHVAIHAVIRRLNDMGVPPPSAGKRTFRDPNRTPRWGQGAVKRILSDPGYKGETLSWRWKSN